MENRRKSFLNEVTNQIRSKEAKEQVSAELNYHMKEAKMRWINKGYSDVDAEQKAIEQMGSPITLGIQLNKIHRPKIDWVLLALLTSVLLLGFLPVLSLGDNSNHYFLMRKMILVVLGMIVAIGFMFIDYRKLAKWGWVFYGVGTVLLLSLNLAPNAWINNTPVLLIGPVTIESIAALPFFMIAWACFFNRDSFKIYQFTLLFLVSLLFFLMIPSFATTYLYFAMVLSMLWWSKFKTRQKAIITGTTIGSLITLAIFSWNYQSYYIKDRITGFLNPEKVADGAGFLVLRIHDLMLNAGWFGGSKNEQQFIPEAHTDFAFVSITYHYGWIAAIFLILILLLILARVVIATQQVRDYFGKLLIIGSLSLLLFQIVSNIGMAFGFFPLTSMSLPFISYGLVPILLNAILIGVVLSVYRRKDLTKSAF
ncbi:FtsW/RodA/SpoVE family cell cycle protein [Fictibacillus phosphorivorans]|uniref:FtsW/RodA/SpoVE family cell cycle protein n=1 Tax=Fictibacillus phosphorivorans TaxID=1221500 RepID=UPI001293C0F9|nr:FtsW/RodA/SpoVE family cell cycle protein [Fictibacillus phosphorivorans]MQR97191.1 FtsW/RodA/SpoVE family cell cycle protein [Fictibacillus phosphorivorans]